MSNSDALTPSTGAASNIRAADYELIAKGNEQAARREIADALKRIIEGVNQYITRKGV